ncbi:MAG: DUF6526 family protein [Terriglobales bacterium]
MAQHAPQTFANHAKFVPAYHAVVFPILAFNLGWSLYRLLHAPGMEAVVSLLVAVALLLLFFFARLFALTVQDRVIRLEMMLRLERLLPPDLRPRIGELSLSQVVALRFASDAELATLTRTVLEGDIQDRKTIKRMVQQWRPDHLRA